MSKLCKDAGVAHIVNLDGVWGNELDAMIRKTEGFENYITTFVMDRCIQN